MIADRRGGRAAARILIADDHELARSGVRAMLESESDLRVVGEVSNGRDALERCRLLRPDLVLMDVRMPDMDGLVATRSIKAEMPEVSVVVLTMHENRDYLLEAVSVGAAGYLLKDASHREIVGAIRTVLRGEALLQPQVLTALLQRLPDEGSRSAPKLAQPLTPRENELLPLLVRGMTNPEIASALTISLGTVKAHVEHILAKLEVSDRTQAAVRAVQRPPDIGQSVS